MISLFWCKDNWKHGNALYSWNFWEISHLNLKALSYMAINKSTFRGICQKLKTHFIFFSEIKQSMFSRVAEENTGTVHDSVNFERRWKWFQLYCLVGRNLTSNENYPSTINTTPQRLILTHRWDGIIIISQLDSLCRWCHSTPRDTVKYRTLSYTLQGQNTWRFVSFQLGP